MAAPNSPNPPAGGAPAAKKKTSPWLFVLIGCAGLIVLAGLAMTIGGYFVLHKVKQAGFDPALMKEHPGLAVAKMVAAINPDVEVVKVDKGTGKITIRDKKSGKTVTVDFDDIKNGHISFETAEGAKGAIGASGSGKQGTVRFSSPEGTIVAGAGVKMDLPAWVPAYPGGSFEGVMKQTTPEGFVRTFHLKTKDSVDDVIKFYAGKLKAAGFAVGTVQNPGGKGGMVTASDDATKRSVMVMVSVEDGQTTAAVTAASKGK